MVHQEHEPVNAAKDVEVGGQEFDPELHHGIGAAEIAMLRRSGVHIRDDQLPAGSGSGQKDDDPAYVPEVSQPPPKRQ